MSSPKAAKAAEKTPVKAAPKKAAAPTRAAPAEPSRSEKAAFLKALVQGIKPGSLAAEKSAAKKNSATKASARKTSADKTSGAKAKKAAAEPAPKVEVLRRISGSAAIKLTPESQQALALAQQLEMLLADGKLENLQPHAMQALMAALCKVYAANDETGERYPILSGRGAVTGTDVMIVCGSLLKAVDLQVFELGMWQSWSGR
jgi:hypothetical protein